MGLQPPRLQENNHNKEERVSHEVEEAFRGCRCCGTLLGGMAFGATTANAAEANISSTTITVNATDANQFYISRLTPLTCRLTCACSSTLSSPSMCLMATLALSWRVWSPVRQWMLLFAAAGYNDQTKGDSLNEWAWLGNTTLTAAQTTAFVNALKDLAVTDITPTLLTVARPRPFTLR